MGRCEKRFDEAIERLDRSRKLDGQLAGLCHALIRAIRTSDHPPTETLDLWTEQLRTVWTEEQLDEYVRWLRRATRDIQREHPEEPPPKRRPKAVSKPSRPRRSKR